jgi:hypothetical protein
MTIEPYETVERSAQLSRSVDRPAVSPQPRTLCLGVTPLQYFHQSLGHKGCAHTAPNAPNVGRRWCL